LAVLVASLPGGAIDPPRPAAAHLEIELTSTHMNPPESGSDQQRKSSERRSNLVLRSLIDEMLERVRELNRKATDWTPDDRARAEADLESIMARVRRIAARRFS
jgi:hypothetical protein